MDRLERGLEREQALALSIGCIEVVQGPDCDLVVL